MITIIPHSSSAGRASGDMRFAMTSEYIGLFRQKDPLELRQMYNDLASEEKGHYTVRITTDAFGLFNGDDRAAVVLSPDTSEEQVCQVVAIIDCLRLERSDNLAEELLKELSQVRAVELSEPRWVFDTFSELIVGVQPMAGPVSDRLNNRDIISIAQSIDRQLIELGTL